MIHFLRRVLTLAQACKAKVEFDPLTRREEAPRPGHLGKSRQAALQRQDLDANRDEAQVSFRTRVGPSTGWHHISFQLFHGDLGASDRSVAALRFLPSVRICPVPFLSPSSCRSCACRAGVAAHRT